MLDSGAILSVSKHKSINIFSSSYTVCSSLKTTVVDQSAVQVKKQHNKTRRSNKQEVIKFKLILDVIKSHVEN